MLLNRLLVHAATSIAAQVVLFAGLAPWTDPALGAVEQAAGIQVVSAAGTKVGKGEGAASAMKSTTIEGTALVDKWMHASQALSDYSFDFSMTVTKKSGETVVQKGTLYFKQPRQLRLEVKSGPSAGSVAVLEKDGNVKGHMGGAMKFLCISLSPDSGYLKSANGWPMVKADFVSLAEAVQGYIKEGCTASVTSSSTASGKTYDWTLNHPNGVIYKRVLFSQESFLPFEWWDYVDGKVFAHSVWTNFKANIPLPDKTFKL